VKIAFCRGGSLSDATTAPLTIPVKAQGGRMCQLGRDRDYTSRHRRDSDVTSNWPGRRDRLAAGEMAAW